MFSSAHYPDSENHSSIPETKIFSSTNHQQEVKGFINEEFITLGHILFCNLLHDNLQKAEEDRRNRRIQRANLKKQQRIVEIIFKDFFCEPSFLNTINEVLFLLIPAKSINLVNIMRDIFSEICLLVTIASHSFSHKSLETKRRDTLNKIASELKLDTQIQADDSPFVIKEKMVSLQQVISQKIDNFAEISFEKMRFIFLKDQQEKMDVVLKSCSWLGCFKYLAREIYSLNIGNYSHCFFLFLLFVAPVCQSNFVRRMMHFSWSFDWADVRRHNEISSKLGLAINILNNDTALQAQRKMKLSRQMIPSLISELDFPNKVAKEFQSFWSQRYGGTVFFSKPTELILEYIGGEERLEAFKTESMIESSLRRMTF